MFLVCLVILPKLEATMLLVVNLLSLIIVQGLRFDMLMIDGIAFSQKTAYFAISITIWLGIFKNGKVLYTALILSLMVCMYHSMSLTCSSLEVVFSDMFTSAMSPWRCLNSPATRFASSQSLSFETACPCPSATDVMREWLGMVIPTSFITLAWTRNNL